MIPEVTDTVGQAFRDEFGLIVAHLLRHTRNWDLAEDCAQDAFARALERWPRDGVPDRPGAWLITTARNCATDRLRREAVGAAKLQEIALDSSLEKFTTEEHLDDSDIPDDRLRLMFTCCHPVLSLDAQVALTLRILAGLTTAEIARAFLVSEATMAKRLVRAKQKIREADIPYQIPARHLLRERTDGVLGVLYLLFTEGYSASAGPDLIRVDLCNEAIRLARVMVGLMPVRSEARALLALMLLHDARRGTRLDQQGDLVPLEEQDRSRWDAGRIAEGLDHLRTAQREGPTGPYQIQAAIAACHVRATDPANTDWAQIAALYERLARFVPSPVIQLNWAVAVAMAQGPSAGLELVRHLEAEGELASYHLLASTRADLLRRLGRVSEAADAYREALALANTETERRYLTRRLAEASGAM
ncbi:MAG: RNA polymerase sigma factor [Jatrophihabitantaceae bacterium]